MTKNVFLKKIYLNIILFGLFSHSIVSAYTVPSSLQQHFPSCLTPNSATENNLVKNLAGSLTNDPFLEDFHEKHLFINTDDLPMRRGVTINEMLRMFSERFPSKISDPEEVLLLVKESDVTFIYKSDFKQQKASSGEQYWVLYSYPRFTSQDTHEHALQKPSELLLKSVSSRDAKHFNLELSRIYSELIFNDHNPQEIIPSWIDQQCSGGMSRSDLTKKLIIYFRKEINKMPDRRINHERKASALTHIMQFLLRNPLVKSEILSIFLDYYNSGKHLLPDADTETPEFNKTYTAAFRFLFYILLDSKCEAVYPLAIHTLMSFTHSAPPFTKIMKNIDNEEIKRALVFASLYTEDRKFIIYNDLDDAYFNVLKDFYSGDIPQHISHVLQPEIFCEFTKNNSAAILFKLRRLFDHFDEELSENIISLLLETIQQKTNIAAKENLFFFADLTANRSPVLLENEELSHKWIDTFIHTAEKGISFHFINHSIATIEKFPEYRRADLKTALLQCLEDPSRDDIRRIIYLFKGLFGHEYLDHYVITHFAEKDSPNRGILALDYMSLRDKAVRFNIMWPLVEDLSSKSMTEHTFYEIRSYCSTLLNLHGENALTAEQRKKVIRLIDTHILNHTYSDFVSASKKPGYKIFRSQSWLYFAGLLRRSDKLPQIITIINTYKNSPDDHVHARAIRILRVLLQINTNESLEIMENFALSLLEDKEEFDQLKYFLKEEIGSKDKNIIQEFFEELINITIDNELKNAFNDLMRLYCFMAPDDAVAFLQLKEKSGIEVDISGIKLINECTNDELDYDAQIPEPARAYFMRWHLTYLINKSDNAEMLALFDEKHSFFRRTRETIKTFILDELGLKEEDLDEEFESYEFAKVFAQLFLMGEIEKIEALEAVLLMKPIVDINKLQISIPKKKTVSYILAELKKHDPSFYEPFSKQTEAYLAWLYKKKILQGDSYLLFDTFSEYFVTKKRAFGIHKPSQFVIHKKNIDRLIHFFKQHILPHISPEHDEPSISEDYFTKTFLRCLGHLWARDVLKRRQESHEGEIVLPILPIFECSILPTKPLLLESSSEELPHSL